MDFCETELIKFSFLSMRISPLTPRQKETKGWFFYGMTFNSDLKQTTTKRVPGESQSFRRVPMTLNFLGKL